jgi:hypothetical protein
MAGESIPGPMRPCTIWPPTTESDRQPIRGGLVRASA